MLKKERLEIIRKYYPNAITLIDNLLRSVENYVSKYPDKKIVVLKVNIGAIPNK